MAQGSEMNIANLEASILDVKKYVQKAKKFLNNTRDPFVSETQFCLFNVLRGWPGQTKRYSGNAQIFKSFRYKPYLFNRPLGMYLKASNKQV